MADRAAAPPTILELRQAAVSVAHREAGVAGANAQGSRKGLVGAHEASVPSPQEKILFKDLNLQVKAGEFLVVAGPNGAGKSTLLKVLLGQRALDQGVALREGKPITRGAPDVGYIPQQKMFPARTPLRVRDFIRLGIDGNKPGMNLGPARRERNKKVDALIAGIGAEQYADEALGALSGGEQQRVRIAQAIAAHPTVLLCDEPLLSLDKEYQHRMSDLIAEQAHQPEKNWDTGGKRQDNCHGTAIVFVTHEIEPIKNHADTVLYLYGDGSGRYGVGKPRDILRLTAYHEDRDRTGIHHATLDID